MKGKNVVFLVIDSLSNFNRKDIGKELMPFLSKLEQKSWYFPNMYSEAPYTEAAVMSMLCGKNTLSDGGYLYRFDNSYNVFDYFKENEYEVYNYIQPHVYPSSIVRGNTHYYCNVCYDFNVLWEYRLYLYAELYAKNALKEDDYKKILKLLDDNFKYWQEFFAACLAKEESVSFISDNLARIYSDEYICEQKQLLQEEVSKYQKDKIAYINRLLGQKKQHELFKIGVLDQKRKVQDSTRAWIAGNYKDVFDEIYKTNKKNNFKIDKLHYKGILHDVASFLQKRGSNEAKALLRNFKIYKDSIWDNDLYERLYQSDGFKAAPSFYSHMKHFEKVLETRKENRPFFSCIHVDDIHNPEIFFTYDTDDLDLLKEELEDIKRTLACIPPDTTGSVSYYLALAYIDKKIKMLFDMLERKGLLEDTVVFITGDHGFSFDYIHLRNSCVNNHYLENYNVPLYIYGADKNNFIDKRVCSSSDILPTILELFGFKNLDQKVEGHSLMSTPRDYVVLQNVMGGCPDVDHRVVSMGILKDNQLLIGEAETKSGFKKIELTEYYDLDKDPYQRTNLVKSVKVEKREIVGILEDEFSKFAARR